MADPATTPKTAAAVVVPEVSPAADAILPVIAAHIDQLAEMPAGPAASAKAADIMALVIAAAKAAQAILSDPGFLAMIPVTWKPRIAATVVLLGFLISGLGVGRYLVPATPSVAQAVAGCQCGCVQTGKCVCKDCDHPQIKASPPVSPKTDVVAPKKLVIYPVTGMDTAALAAELTASKLPMQVTVAAASAPGSYLPRGDKKIPLPCAEVLSFDGHMIDAASFTGSADLAAWANKAAGKTP